ncbi:MAG: hypothetical protein D6815_02840 [Candidatus Dadabacteria bacterium]|nr:MAG: hypothetical protein D6815_02840 [Candidatus Dadabacteria bacterium]
MGVQGVSRRPRRITLLELLTELLASDALSEQRLIAAALDQVLSGRVVLCGIVSLAERSRRSRRRRQSKSSR